MKKKETKVADFARKLVGPSGGVNCQPRSAESGNLSIPFSHRHFWLHILEVRDATEITHQLNQANRTRMPEFIKCPSNFE